MVGSLGFGSESHMYKSPVCQPTTVNALNLAVNKPRIMESCKQQKRKELINFLVDSLEKIMIKLWTRD